jgi:hypothetical protein
VPKAVPFAKGILFLFQEAKGVDMSDVNSFDASKHTAIAVSLSSLEISSNYLHVGDSATGNGGLDREIWAPDPPAALSAFELKGI